MAEPNERVLARVREEISLRPDIPPGVLFQMAQAIEPAIAEQTLQQFHIRYVLPALQEVQAPPKRRQRRRRSDAKKPPRQPRKSRAASRPAPEEAAQPEERQEPEAPAEPRTPEPRQPGRQRKPRRATHGERERIRAIFLRFAMGLARAESSGEIVEAIRRVDEYADEVLERP